MLKKIIMRGAYGFPVGVAIGYGISIACSLCFGNGYYSPCAPGLAEMVGSEIGAVILQAVLMGIIGTGFAAGSVVWDMEEWSLVKQTGLYFLLGFVLLMPAAFALNWMEHSLGGALGFFVIFLLIFVFIWVITFLAGRRSVRKMNESLHRAMEE